MSTALQTPPAPTVTPDEIALIKNTVAKDATDAELKLFLFDCQRQGVHPLDRLLVFTKRGGKYTPVTSIDFMRIRAAETGEMAGSDDAVFTGMTEQKFPLAATVTVYRITQGQRFAYTGTARWFEYKPPDDFMWRKMPHTMLAKCAEAVALRKGFPKQLAGLYAKEEMDQADAPEQKIAFTYTKPPTADGAIQAYDIEQRAAQAPRLPEKPEKPDAGTVENPGTTHPAWKSVLDAAAVSNDVVVNTETGEVLPEGFALIDDYTPDNDWHRVTWNLQVFKTKVPKIGEAARVAFNDRVAVRLHSKKPPYLDRVERLDGGEGLMSKADIAKTKWNPDDLKKQGF